ncbi:MAG: anti-sigma factor family protein [Gemmatimonadales bacterium]
MILIVTEDNRHVDDGDLIRLHDGECDPAEERLIRNHLAGCSRCRDNAEELAQLAQGFSSALRELEEPEPLPIGWYRAARGSARGGLLGRVKRSRRSAWVVTAVVAILAVTLTVTPARAWVLGRLAALKSLMVHATPESVEQGQRASSLVSFVPTSGQFLIDVTRTQPGGTLSIVVDTVIAASARILGGAGKEEMMVLQAGFRIRDNASSRASYEFRLPRSLELVEVRVAGKTVVRYDVTEMAERGRWEIDLTRSEGR